MFRFLFVNILLFILASVNLYSFETKEFYKPNVTTKIVVGSIIDSKGYGAIEFNINHPYKTYWRTSGESGFPLNVDISKSNLESLDLLWLIPDRYNDKYGFESYIYKNKVIIPFEFVIKNNEKIINFFIKLNFAICADVCIPYEEDINFNLPNNYVDKNSDSLIVKSFLKLPKKINFNLINLKQDYEDKSILISFDKYNIGYVKDIFVENENFIFKKPIIDVINNRINAKINFSDIYSNSNIKNEVLRFTIVGSDNSYDILLKPSTIRVTIMIFLFAFLGGLILNIMPCVLPVISLKVAQLTYSDCKISYKNQLLLTILGLFVSFMLIALVIFGLQKTGEIVGWGFHFQNPSFIVFILYVLLVFAISQFGLTTLKLSSKTSNFLDNILNKLSYDNWLFHFLYGIIITLLATPCTAPFLGTSIAFALTQGFLTIVGIFLAIAFGLSTPYFLLLILPKNTKIIPKAGNWLNYVKYFAGFLLYSSCLWLYFILIQQLNLLIASIIFISMHLTIIGFIKTKFKIFFIIVGIVILSSSFFISNIFIDYNNIDVSKDKLIWHKLEPNVFNDITIKQKKIIFIDITASWCLTCKFNEFNVLKDQDVQKALSDNNVYLIKEDITKPNKDVMDFIYKNNRRGIPFYAIIKQGKINVLSEILDKDLLIKQLSGD